MGELKCKICGENLDVEKITSITTCKNCGIKQTMPKLSDERLMQMYDRANYFRRSGEYDKAMSLFEQILHEDKTDPEAYWSIVLCRYGVEFVEDPSTHQYKPTINRTQFASIFEDKDYKSAIKYATPEQREIYEVDAKSIDEIHKSILEISQKEEPFDVFICYKETDKNGCRTPDSLIANDIYNELTQEGLKAFLGKTALEDKNVETYEPYIFAALNSAKTMIVIGTRPEYFKDIEVRNQWSRFLNQIKAGTAKSLIPAYKDMNLYDLPDEFSDLMALDISKISFMPSLFREIKRISESKTKEPINETIKISDISTKVIEKLYKNALKALADIDFKKADNLSDNILEIDPENAKAYLIKLMLDFNCSEKEYLGKTFNPIDSSYFYKMVMRFGDKKLQKELKRYVKEGKKYREERDEFRSKEYIYNNACYLISKETIESNQRAIHELESLGDYQEAKQKILQCKANIQNITYKTACEYMKENDLRFILLALSNFKTIEDFKDSKEKITDCNHYIEKFKENKIKAFDEIINNMIECPAGSFIMGSPAAGERSEKLLGFLTIKGAGEIGRNNDEILHEVIISKPFKIGRYPLTQMLFRAIKGFNPSAFKCDDNPVENVSWIEAKDFCEILNREFTDKIPKGYKFDLPTEAQWEYACRAGTTTALNNGKNLSSLDGFCSNLDEVAWYKGNACDSTHPVGQKKPNAWCIYDMHGNVNEWCRDWYSNYSSSSVTDPDGADEGHSKVRRGGSWSSDLKKCRSACRQVETPNYKEDHIGFRLALVPINE